MVQHWLALTGEDEYAIHDGLGMVVGRIIGVFYVNGGLMRSRDPERLQGTLHALIVLGSDSHLMISQPTGDGRIITQQLHSHFLLVILFF